MSDKKSNQIETLEIRRVFNASRQQIFQAWTQPETIVQWFAPTSEHVTSVPKLDLIAGGQYRIEMKAPDGNTYSAIGEYLEISEPEKLVFTWAWDGGDSGMLVTIDLYEKNNGTELVLTHEKFPDSGSRDHHNEGWIGCLDRLVSHINHSQPKRATS